MTSSNPILVFDLDDTLHDELAYVRSGLGVVAAFAAGETGCDRQHLYDLLEQALGEGRSRVFDRAFERAGIASARLLRRCVGVYRTHQPRISLYPAAARCLERFAGERMFLVTDGNTSAQGRKVAALDLERRFERVFLTWRHGRARAKPSPYCFERIRQIAGTPARDVIYIADNPAKDFVGIRPLGYGTIRVLTGQHAGVAAAPGHDAALNLPDLDALTHARIRTFHQGLKDAYGQG